MPFVFPSRVLLRALTAQRVYCDSFLNQLLKLFKFETQFPSWPYFITRSVLEREMALGRTTLVVLSLPCSLSPSMSLQPAMLRASVGQERWVLWVFMRGFYEGVCLGWIVFGWEMHWVSPTFQPGTKHGVSLIASLLTWAAPITSIYMWKALQLAALPSDPVCCMLQASSLISIVLSYFC